MAVKSRQQHVIRQTFLLDKAKKRREGFSPLKPEIVSSVAGLRNSLAHATKDSLWISYERDLTEALLRNVSWPARHSLGWAVFVHPMKPQTLAVVSSCFKRFTYSAEGGFLAANELATALDAANRGELFIGGSVDHASQTITLWRGDLQPLVVPFSAFPKSGDGTTPDFKRFSVADYGQTVRLGDYEAAADAILYEFDPEYRRRLSKERQKSERTFGASVRRLRKQRGLRREDFGPELSAKTIARIEQGKVKRVRNKTVSAIAERMGVRMEEIGSY